jgi:hypothetical protein
MVLAEATGMKIRTKALPLLVSLLVSMAPAASLASDHADGPSTALDRAGDISDLYTFTSPKDPDKVVLIMNVMPFASRDSLFSDKVNYRFRIRAIDDPKSLAPSSTKKEQTVVCTFAGKEMKQQATCVFKLAGAAETLTFATVSGTIGGQAQKGDLQAFAGLRSDPFFSDFERTANNVNNNSTMDTKARGSNGDQGANVLSIAVQFSRQRLITPMVAITAQTTRKP